jgi:2-dehydropantoate 2-reductase
MRIAVVGAGAIGTWLGAALSHAGHDVALIARGAHLEALRREGARVTGETEFVADPLATDDPGAIGTVDAVLLTVKAHDQLAVAPLVARLLGPHTAIVAAQNGIPWWYFSDRHIEAVDPAGALSALLPRERALGMVVYMGATISAPGVVATRPEAGLVIGEPDGSDSPRLAAIAGALTDAGFPVRVSEDIRTELWTKLMGNVAFNQISLLTRAGLGTMAQDPGVRRVVATMMAETVEIARASGADPTISIEDRLAITARLGDHKPSTLQDLEAGKRLELDAIAAAVVELADLGGVEAPTVRTVTALADLQARRLGLR